jgi:hypothetical protein
MVRLILLTAPIASVLGGIALGHLMSWMVGSIFPATPNAAAMWAAMMGNDTEIQTRTPPKQETSKKSSVKKDKKKGSSKTSEEGTVASSAIPKNARDPYPISAIRLAVSVYILTLFIPKLPAFYEICDTMAQVRSASAHYLFDYLSKYLGSRHFFLFGYPAHLASHDHPKGTN